MYGGRNIGAIRRHHHGQAAPDPFAGFLVYDSVTRADNATTVGAPTEKGVAPTVDTGTWGVSGGKIYNPTHNSGGLLWWAAAHSGSIQADVMSTAYATNGPGVTAWFIDSSNYMLLRLLSGQLQLLTRTTAGGFNSLLTPAATLVDSTAYTIKLVYTGANVQGWFQGTKLIDTTIVDPDLTALALGAKSGLRNGGGTLATDSSYDNIQVT